MTTGSEEIGEVRRQVELKILTTMARALDAPGPYNADWMAGMAEAIAWLHAPAQPHGGTMYVRVTK